MAEQQSRRKPATKKPAKKPQEQKSILRKLFGARRTTAEKDEAHQARQSKKEVKRKARGKEPAVETAAGTGTQLQQKGIKLARVTGWVVVVFLAVTSVAFWLGLGDSSTSARPVVEDQGDVESQQAGDYARRYVGSWLRATKQDDAGLSNFTAVDSADITADSPSDFRELSVASVDTSDSGLSTVMISAEVQTPDEEDSEDSSDSDDEESQEQAWATSWYQVSVFSDGDSFAPMGWPAPVPAPDTGEAPVTDYRNDASSEVTSTVKDFFNAYILGDGEVARLTHPDSTITALGSNNWVGVDVASVSTVEDHGTEVPADGTTAHAQAELTLQQGESSGRAATYTLTLETRGGRWEVREIDTTPEVTADAVDEAEGPDGSTPDPLDESTEDTTDVTETPETSESTETSD